MSSPTTKIYPLHGDDVVLYAVAVDNKAEVEKNGRGHYHRDIVAPPDEDGGMAGGFFACRVEAENIKQRAERDYPDLRFVLLEFSFEFKDAESEVVG